MTRAKTAALSLCLLSPAAALADPVPGLNLTDTFAPLKRTLAAGGVGHVMVIGDSLSFRPGSWLYPFVAKLQAAYGNAGGGYQGFSFQSGAGFDGGWVRGAIDEDDAPYHSLDGLWATTTAATTASYQPQTLLGDTSPSAYSSYTIQYVTQPGGGSFNQFYWGPYAGINSSPSISTDGPQGVGTATFASGNTPTTPWYYTHGDGQVTILGQSTSTGLPGVAVDRVSNGGWGVENFLHRDWTFDAQVKIEDPKLVLVWLGQNDQWAQSPQQYAAEIQKLVDRVQGDVPGAKICLVGTYDQDDWLSINVEGMREVAAADGLGFIDLYHDAGDTNFFQSNGYLDDGVHFSTAGGEYMGNLMFNAFQTDGASLVPEPASVSVVALAACGVLMRRRR